MMLPVSFETSVTAWLHTLPGCALTVESGGVLRVSLDGGPACALRLGTPADPLTDWPESSVADRRVTLWEDQWHTKREIIQSRLLALLGRSGRIPARLTQLRRLDRPTTLHFLQKNHLHAPVLARYSYGLLLPARYFRVLPFAVESYFGESPAPHELLVALATFARPRRFMQSGRMHVSYEMVRFTNILGHTVVGGLGKLLQHFGRLHRPDDVMTYADLEWSDGQSYQRLDFEARGDTGPQHFFVDPSTMLRYEPHRLPGGLEPQKAPERGFIEIKNAGSRKFVKLMYPQNAPF